MYGDDDREDLKPEDAAKTTSGTSAASLGTQVYLKQHHMKTIRKYWYLLVLLLIALVVNENFVQWCLAVQVGYTVAAGFEDAYEYFTLRGYLFFTAFRLVPYLGLGIILLALSKTSLKDYCLPVFAGGLVGILALIIWGSWMALRPLYTAEHVSSTTGIAFIFIPIYAVPTGIIGAALLAALYTPFRLLLKRKGTGQPAE